MYRLLFIPKNTTIPAGFVVNEIHSDGALGNN